MQNYRKNLPLRAFILHCAFYILNLNWSPRLVSRQRLLGFSEALICLSYSGDGSPSRSSASEGWSSRQVMLLRPPRSEQGRLLLTLHPENGCQTWTRTKTSGLTGRRATLTLSGNGAADRIGFPSPASQLPNKRRSLHEKQSHLHRSV